VRSRAHGQAVAPSVTQRDTSHRSCAMAASWGKYEDAFYEDGFEWHQRAHLTAAMRYARDAAQAAVVREQMTTGAELVAWAEAQQDADAAAGRAGQPRDPATSDIVDYVILRIDCDAFVPRRARPDGWSSIL